MLLKAITDGSVAATGPMKVPSGILGGVLVTTDGTNAAVVIVRRNDANGKAVFKISTKTPLFITGPIGMEGTQDAYYDVSGTGAAAQFYEWNE
jgi:hypothetical protein